MKYSVLMLIALMMIKCHSPEKKINKYPKSIVIGENEGLARISVFAQDRPNGPRKDIEMPIHPTPSDLETVAASTVELNPEERVIGIIHKGEAICYPVRYLSLYEVLNDQLDNRNLTVSWCPLVRTALVFSSEHLGDSLYFDFGEALVNNNLLLVDRKTKSVWSQLSGKAFTGKMDGKQLDIVPALQTNWAFWYQKYPNSLVMTIPNRENRGVYYYKDSLKIKSDTMGRYLDVSSVGIGLVLKADTLFVPFETLKIERNPKIIDIENRKINFYYDTPSQTAWAMEGGKLLSSTIVSEEAWLSFYPNSLIY